MKKKPVPKASSVKRKLKPKSTVGQRKKLQERLAESRVQGLIEAETTRYHDALDSLQRSGMILLISVGRHHAVMASCVLFQVQDESGSTFSSHTRIHPRRVCACCVVEWGKREPNTFAETAERLGAEVFRVKSEHDLWNIVKGWKNEQV